MTRKNTPEFIDISDTKLDDIKARITSGSLLDEDKRIILVIMVAYTWMLRQLEYTKITIARLKNLFGFSTEKRNKRKSAETHINSGNLILNLDNLLDMQSPAVNELQAQQEDPLKK